VIGSNLTQIINDTGSVAKFLHGFEGRAWGVGPLALYVAKLEKPGIFLQLRWINEFEVANLLKGNTFMLRRHCEVQLSAFGAECSRVFCSEKTRASEVQKMSISGGQTKVLERQESAF